MRSSCSCSSGSLPFLQAGAAVAPHPALPRVCEDPTPVPAGLPDIAQVLNIPPKSKASFRWTTSSTGMRLLEIEMSGVTAWIPVLTVKP